MTTSSEAPPRSARREATRQRILGAASQTLAERGFHGTSVEEVCERAGFTRGAFYSNFASREELVAELVQQRTVRLRERVLELAAQEDLTPHELWHGVLALWSGQPGQRQQWLLLQTELMLHAIRDPEAGATWREVIDRSQEDVAAALDAFLERHHLSLPITSMGLSRLLFATFQGGALQHLLDPQRVGPDDLEEQLLSVLEHALDRAG
ncbi:TetR/AcrR family transcriptional regulator [Arsenicicoccus sp. oral taxon 190]|uniref:TetR/AcrR family transcriptional regulator n=1 Tax=Arsenicicoccus sp. oral taxon 190 TaxID=1658671 RepID=UPI00067C16F3|nr:TetR/AcrR family transcriptional regulator [Arsenicicoccus sp. oral taxon 190]